MRRADLFYDLPDGLIAQEPIEPRDASRLMVLDRRQGTLHHASFGDLPELLAPGDVLVANDTRVRPARVRGHKASTGTAVELLLLRPVGPARWEALARPGRRLRPGDAIVLGRLRARVVEARERVRVVAFDAEPAEVDAYLEAEGEAPLPPYIRRTCRDPRDRQRYQTIYAAHTGAIAAPTAGLHFTEAVRARLAARGIGWATLTLHVGWGTFAPVEAERLEDHHVAAESFVIPAATADAALRARARGGRIVAVGTTTVRALESVPALGEGAGGETDLVIHPPYAFKHVDALVTNFHLPESSLLALVAAFAGIEAMREAYAVAVKERYRFYSYGDAILIT